MSAIYCLVVLGILALGAHAARPGVSSSRRILAGALVLLVPIAGPVLAMLVRRTRGGKIELEPELALPERRMTAGDVRRLGELPSMLERLITNDAGERLAALVDLSCAGDAAAISVLRWTIDQGPSDVVLDAALTLEEIDLRCEARAAAAAEALAELPTWDRALEAGDAAACSVLTGMADAALAPTLAAQARDYYQLALELAPDRCVEIEERRARLELASGQPRAALNILVPLAAAATVPADRARLEELRDDAAFASREFGLLSFVPRSPSDDISTMIAARQAAAARALRRTTSTGHAALRRTGS